MRLLHGHIFKNGGTTFEGILTSTFGSGHLIVKDETRMRRERYSYLLQLIQEKPFQALSTHFLPVQDALKDDENFVIVFLRDPIERALSVYEFEKKQKHDTPGAINAKRMNSREYFEWRLSSESPPTVRDFQTRYLLQSSRLSDFVMSDIISMLERTPNLFVGILESFHESVLRLKTIMAEKEIILPGNYERRNENKKTSTWTRERKYEYLKELVGASLYQRLIECNRYDIDLYEGILQTA